MNRKNHPGVYIPPPLIYAVFFLISIGLEKIYPVKKTWLNTTPVQIAGWVLIGLWVLITFAALRRFITSKNTLITVKPASSLQTTGVYASTRNPMYLGLVLLYCGLAVLVGNWWTFILLPVLIMVIQGYVIHREEQYLHHAFGEQYDAYKKKVRRWI